MLRAVVLLLTLSGCSFAFTRNPPPACSSSSIAPIADTAIAVVAALGAVYFAISDEAVGTVVESGLALGFGASAYTGYRRVGHCRDVKAAAR